MSSAKSMYEISPKTLTVFKWFHIMLHIKFYGSPVRRVLKIFPHYIAFGNFISTNAKKKEENIKLSRAHLYVSAIPVKNVKNALKGERQ